MNAMPRFLPALLLLLALPLAAQDDHAAKRARMVEEVAAMAKLLGSATLGFGAPSTVAVAGHEITGGNAVFRTDYVQDPGRNPVRKLRSLYLHELGHVLGLSHASLSQNIMYPIVDRNVTLGAGDVSGIHAMTKTCAAKPA